ncbi:MAG: signal peptidase I [Ignavibacteriales bacterium]|nr:signal peptidase I [Ignavibacteriaceae bacterium]NLH61146.1 signal peptidase I [Ignavibacteriales bacterium]HOJ17566.1 signal peptidase I [Ignavibacteriaceae bacterium]HPO56820.1 signal peptidase I [Ignavibacteriaceae bacterium]
MSFKDRLRRFVGIKTEEELKIVKTPREKAIEFVKSLFFAGIAALLIITFIIQNTRIPTGSMERTILVGDFVLVNKFIYGSSSGKYIPFTEIEIPYFTLPSIREPEPNDVVVFEYPGDRDDMVSKTLNLNYVKRLIGMPGDVVEIRDKVVFVNNKEFPIPPNIQYLSPFPVPKGQVNPRIFPNGAPWNEDNYGPLKIPKKGLKIDLTPDNVEWWRTIIDREHGKRVVGVTNGTITIEGKPVSSYTFKKDYYFMMGDNRDDSADSRYWGLVPRDMVVGQAFIVLFSWDRDIPFTQLFKLLASIRLDRVLKLIY